jgi:hypothetical protein
MEFKTAETKEEKMDASRHLVKSFGQKKGQRYERSIAKEPFKIYGGY